MNEQVSGQAQGENVFKRKNYTYITVVENMKYFDFFNGLISDKPDVGPLLPLNRQAVNSTRIEFSIQIWIVYKLRAKVTSGKLGPVAGTKKAG